MQKMFYVWEGNHRTVALQAVKEMFSKSKEKHYRVLCTFIDPTKVFEIAFLTSLQRMNVASELAICRRVVVLHHAPYTYVESFGKRLQVTTSFTVARLSTRSCLSSNVTRLKNLAGEGGNLYLLPILPL